MRTVTLLWSVLFLAAAGCGGEAKSAAVPQTLPLSKDEFAREFCRRIIDIDPTVSAVPSGECRVALAYSKNERHTADLSDAYNDYITATENVTLIVNRAVDEHHAIIREARESAIDTSHILPIVTSSVQLDRLQSRLSAPAEGSDPAAIYFEPLNEQLVVVYELVAEDKSRLLSSAEVASLECSSEHLRNLAIENLHRQLPEMRQYGDRQVSLVAAGGRYEASLLLFESLWTKELFPVDGDIVVAIPGREVLFVTGSKDKAGMEQMASLVQEGFTKSDNPITKQLFVREGKEWRLFEP